MAGKGLCDDQLSVQCCHPVTTRPQPQVPHPHIFWMFQGWGFHCCARTPAVTVSPVWPLTRFLLPCAQGFVSPPQTQPRSQRECLFWEQQPQEQLV